MVELVGGGQGRRIELIEVVTVLTTGGLFGGLGGILELRRPMKNWAMNPCGSSEKLNPIDGVCCYRDARWSPDGTYIVFVFQRFDSTDVGLYYVPFGDWENGQSLTPIDLPDEFLTQRDKPQPALRPAQ